MPPDVIPTTDDPAALREALVAMWHEKEAVRREKEALEGKAKALEDELSVLLARITELTLKLARATDRPEQLALELELKVLRERLSNHATETFGSRSERRPVGEPAAKPPPKRSRHGGRRTEQSKLPYVEEVRTLDEADQCCPGCGCGLREMAEQFEASEVVVAIERTYKVVHEKRQKYRCNSCGHIDTALGRPRLLPGSRYDLSFVVQVAIDKYLDHLPLERQVEAMRRRGLVVTSQTLWDQLYALYVVLLPTLVAIKEQLLAKGLVHVDESPWRMMGKEGSKKWWLWAMCAGELAWYAIESTRGADAALALLGAYDGIVVADGYSVYTSLEQARTKRGEQLDLDGNVVVLPDFVLVACWMHARRFFYKAREAAPEAEEALDLIAAIYRADEAAREAAAGDDDAFLELRRRDVRPLIDKLDAWRKAQRPLPRSQLDKGINYLAVHWTALTRFLDDVRIPLDNGEAERAIRGPVVGRKNHLGSRSPRGAVVTAAMYTLVETCRRCGVDPYAWMMEAARRAIAVPGTVLLPSDYKAELEAAA
ncbi:MAG TPA: IS66 family transposase [Nannocystis sp.]